MSAGFQTQYNLRQVAGSVTSIAGKVGNGLNNTSNLTDIQAASHADFDFTRSEGFTIETWARTSNTDGTYWHMLFGKRGPTGGTIVRAGHWGSSMIFTVRTSTGQNKGLWYTTPQPVNDGQWHHWVFFLDETNIGYWMDGELVFSEPHGLTSGDFSASVPFDVMNDTNEPNRWLGDVDEFAVYRGVLSQAEIVGHYNNGAGKYYANSTDTTTVAQAPSSDFKPVGYQLPNTTNLGPAGSPLQQTSTIASFTYDGDGRQVKAVVGSTTTYYVGAHYQVENGVVTKYYLAGAQRVAMRENGTLYYLLADHLGSTSITTNASGALVSELRYKAWGETRYSSGTTPTSYRYTGQREEASFGLYFYNARWYDPYLNHFTQPDTIVPDPYNSQDWNRYAYARNNPLKYTDPSGHLACDDQDDNGKCINYQQNLFRKINKNYSNWERRILRKLYDKGGPNAVYGVFYIVEHSIHITVKSGWQSGFGSRGAWYEGDDLVVLNADLKNADGSPVYSLNEMPTEWGLANVIHEAKHIEQGPELAFSKLGEMEAWQIGIDVAENLGWYQKYGWNPRDSDVKNATTVADFSKAIQTHDKPYWKGLFFLLDYPISFYTNPCMMMVFCQ